MLCGRAARMTGSYFSVTIVGTRRRLDLSLPADVPVGELTGELAAMLDEPADGPPPRSGLVRLGGGVVDGELGLAAQPAPPGARLFLRGLDVAAPPAAAAAYPTPAAAAVPAA